MQTIEERAQFANSANDALLKICGRQIKALEEICRLSRNPFNLFRIRKVARVALEDRTVQLRNR